MNFANRIHASDPATQAPTQQLHSNLTRRNTQMNRPFKRIYKLTALFSILAMLLGSTGLSANAQTPIHWEGSPGNVYFADTFNSPAASCHLFNRAVSMDKVALVGPMYGYSQQRVMYRL